MQTNNITFLIKMFFVHISISMVTWIYLIITGYWYHSTKSLLISFGAVNCMMRKMEESIVRCYVWASMRIHFIIWKTVSFFFWMPNLDYLSICMKRSILIHSEGDFLIHRQHSFVPNRQVFLCYKYSNCRWYIAAASIYLSLLCVTIMYKLLYESQIYNWHPCLLWYNWYKHIVWIIST